MTDYIILIAASMVCAFAPYRWAAGLILATGIMDRLIDIGFRQFALSTLLLVLVAARFTIFNWRNRIPFNPVMWAALGYLGLKLVGTTWNDFPQYAVYYQLAISRTLLTVLVLWQIVRTAEDVKVVIYLAIAFALFMALQSIPFIGALFGVEYNTGYGDRLVVLGAGDPNVLSFNIGVAGLLFLWWNQMRGELLSTYATIALFLVLITGIAFTASRSGLLGLFIALGIIYIRKISAFLIVAPLVALLMISYSAFELGKVFSVAEDRFSGTSAFTENERFRIWELHSQIWLESPLFGKGTGSEFPESFSRQEFQDEFNTYDYYEGTATHNMFMNSLVETGLFGLLTTLFFLYRAFMASRKSILLLSTFFFMSWMCMFNPVFYGASFWFFAAFLFTIFRIFGDEARQVLQPSQEPVRGSPGRLVTVSRSVPAQSK
ncbi:MAG: hypothetical protein GMKNLPBB_03124 [Myxococcota bacterium]|nr:hypothetical protein [Myxococcota bacterium]